ncbi:MAG: type II toxin-antitoxin system VapC family toxin [Actinomycetota bacterium]
MILVDTSVWIDHLHRADPQLTAALEADEVGQHPYVLEELALGSIPERPRFLVLLESLRPFPLLSHGELMALVEARQLWGRGLSAVDAHLIGSVLLAPAGRLWTRDSRLRSVADECGVPLYAG